MKSLAGFLGRNTTLTIALLGFFVGWITVKISKLEIFGLNINELTMTLAFAVTIYVLVWGTRYWINSTSRNVIYMKRKEFFHLVKLSMDISTEVLRKLMAKILFDAKYGGCLHKFLDDEKHYLYHQWQGSTPCCKCPSTGCTLGKSKKMKEWLFKMLYKGNPRDGIHVKFNNHRISDYCLDCFKPSPGLTINHFDVTVLSFFIEHFVSLSSKEISALKDVIAVRNSICHARNTSSFQPKELESLWIKLSEASLTLTDSPSRNLLKDQISMIKKVEFDSADIEILKEKVEREGEMLEEICKFLNQNGVTKDCIKESEGRIVSHINTKIEGIHDDVKALKEGQSEFADQQEKTGDKLGIIIEMLHAIKLEAHVYAEKKDTIGYDTGELTERLIDAVGRIDNKNIDERLVVENITKSSDTDDKQDNFKVVSAQQSCIILNLKCTPYVLKSEQSFRLALKSLLLDIVRAGIIDTGSPLTIVLQLNFCSPLTEDEIDIIKHIDVRKGDTTNVSSSQDVKEIQKNFEMYNILSFESHVLEITKKDGIIILTDESHIPAEADVEVRLWGSVGDHLALPAKVVKNVIEFEIPWNIFHLETNLHGNELLVSVFDKQMKIETSRQTIELKNTDQYMNVFKLKPEVSYYPSSRTSSSESGFRSDKEDDYCKPDHIRQQTYP
ncbi:Hypothetical predicted protein [Mytilus galloprovincialis]|uniref:DZIP3-like HEPN domain-containing protein n=1 Tax=Mytilus galloprovincialis TaxID=29158 RepID=A0A8B6G102_MYTGA|nr:Hypothetical predicted protein [Mytilus galloprovincialis]